MAVLTITRCSSGMQSIYWFWFLFPPSSLKAFGVWWKGFKQVPFYLKAFPALFLPTCCFQACSLWTAATTSHKGGSLSLGMEDLTWKTPGEVLACGVKGISSRRKMKCISSRWNNSLAMSWKRLPSENSEQEAVRKMCFLLSLAWFWFWTRSNCVLASQEELGLRKNRQIHSGQMVLQKKVAERWQEGKGRSGCESRMERGSLSDTGSGKSVRNDVSQPLKRARELVVHENRVNKKKLVWVHRGFLFPSVALMAVVRLQLLTALSHRLCSCLSLHILSFPFLVLPLKLVPKLPWSLGTWEQSIQFLSYHPMIQPVF